MRMYERVRFGGLLLSRKKFSQHFLTNFLTHFLAHFLLLWPKNELLIYER